MSIVNTASFTATESIGDVSVSYTIYLKDRRVFFKETVGELSEEKEIDYQALPEAVLKAYQGWITHKK